MSRHGDGVNSEQFDLLTGYGFELAIKSSESALEGQRLWPFNSQKHEHFGRVFHFFDHVFLGQF